LRSDKKYIPYFLYLGYGYATHVQQCIQPAIIIDIIGTPLLDEITKTEIVRRFPSLGITLIFSQEEHKGQTFPGHITDYRKPYILSQRKRGIKSNITKNEKWYLYFGNF